VFLKPVLVEPIWIRLGQMRTKCEDTVAILPKVNNPNHPAHWQKKEKKRNLIKQQHCLCYLQLPATTWIYSSCASFHRPHALEAAAARACAWRASWRKREAEEQMVHCKQIKAGRSVPVFSVR